MHFGILSAPVPGHLYPNCMLSKELIRRGHQATVFNIPDAEAFVRKLGVGYSVIGEQEFPLYSWHKEWKVARTGTNVFRDIYILNVQIEIARIMMRDLPHMLNEQKVDVLLVDHLQPQGASMAEYLGIPFITVCSILPLHPDSTGIVPPSFAWWMPTGTLWDKWRNRTGHFIAGLLARHYFKMVNKWRKKWQLKPMFQLTESFSSLAQISVMPDFIDFPRPSPSPVYYAVGPFLEKRKDADFPWEQLDGRPIVYASMGTIRNQIKKVFQAILRAFEDMQEFQLVISKGAWSGDGVQFENLPGNPLVVEYAPQVELLERAVLCITHAGPGTILECVYHNVPMVAIPITDDQPAMATRIKYHHLGKVIPWRKVNADKVKNAVYYVLSDNRCKEAVGRMSKKMRELGGAPQAADIIEQAVLWNSN